MVSIIIAVYNTEKYIDKCFESIQAQTYDNYEVIVVDDGSTDSSGEKCDDIRREDNRFRVVHKENGGAASARNVGIELAKGDYFVFIDSDDYIEPDMLENMLNIALSDKEITFVNCGMVIQYETQNVIKRFNKGNNVFSAEEALISFFKSEGYITASFADKLIKREVFDRGLRFDEKIGNEDTEIVPRLIDMSDKIVVDGNAYYHYVKHSDSTSENKIFSKRIYEFIPSLYKFGDMCKFKYSLAIPWYDYYMANTYNGMYMYLCECDDRRKHGGIAIKLRLRSFIQSASCYKHRDVVFEKKIRLQEFIYRAILGNKLYETCCNR